MTQQRTYAAQARKMLKNFGGGSQARAFAYWASQELDVAQHFVMPDNGLVLDDNLKGLNGMGSDLIQLPYSSITLSFYDTASSLETLVLYFEKGGAVRFVVFVKKTGWSVLPFIGTSERISVKEGTITSKNALESLSDSRMSKTEYDTFFKSSLFLLMEFLEALTCKNVTHEPLPASKVRGLLSRNRSLPEYETRVLVINASKASVGTRSSGGTHASPRQHLRRGHIRRLESGNIWVNSCVVGSEGSIKKEYHVL